MTAHILKRASGMPDEFVWEVVRLHPFGIPTITRYRLVRRHPAGGAVVLNCGQRKTLRPSGDRDLLFTEAGAVEAARRYAERAKQRIADAQRQLERAATVRDVPAEGWSGPIKPD